ncbi:MAG: hypothetical protein M0R02_08190 [Bacteroidales bacterium]|nr:hypothetical protein [Bacteroidales bacterium]
MKNTSIIIVLFSFFCVGCQEIDCPHFPDNLNYFPYVNGQELKFTNNQSDIHSFTIISKENSIPESFSSNCKCACDVYTKIAMISNEDSMRIECWINISSRQDIHFIRMGSFIDNTQITEFLSKEIELKQFKLTFKDYNKISKYLEDTILLENENNQFITKMVFIKNKGLVSYTTVNGEEWNVIDTNQ